MSAGNRYGKYVIKRHNMNLLITSQNDKCGIINHAILLLILKI
jgi:hypothetical protein